MTKELIEMELNKDGVFEEKYITKEAKQTKPVRVKEMKRQNFYIYDKQNNVNVIFEDFIKSFLNKLVRSL